MTRRSKRKAQSADAVEHRWQDESLHGGHGERTRVADWRIVPMPRDGHCMVRGALTDTPDAIASTQAVRDARRTVAQRLLAHAPAEREALAAAEGDARLYADRIAGTAAFAGGPELEELAAWRQRHVFVLELNADGSRVEKRFDIAPQDAHDAAAAAAAPPTCCGVAAPGARCGTTTALSTCLPLRRSSAPPTRPPADGRLARVSTPPALLLRTTTQS